MFQFKNICISFRTKLVNNRFLPPPKKMRQIARLNTQKAAPHPLLKRTQPHSHFALYIKSSTGGKWAASGVYYKSIYLCVAPLNMCTSNSRTEIDNANENLYIYRQSAMAMTPHDRNN